MNFLFYAIILVAGIEESIPSTEDETFRILIEPNVVENVDFVPDEGLFFTLIPNTGEEPLLIKIPKNFPIFTTHDDAAVYDPMVAVGEGLELQSELVEDDCFFNYVISVQGSTSVDLLYTYPPTGEPHIVSRSVDSRSCLEKSLYKQIQDRTAGQILYCNNPDHLLVLRPGLKFACVYPETAVKKSWHPVVFDDNGNATVSDSVNVRTREKDHRISYTVIKGLLSDMRYPP